MNAIRFCAGAAVVAGALAVPAIADGRNAGSALIFTVHRSGIQSDVPSTLDFFTIVSVTNTNTAPQTPFSFGGSTLVHYEYANVIPDPILGDPFHPAGCTVFDRVEFLTPADTFSVLTSCHNATSGPGQQGYLVVSAQDPAQFNVAWAHDFLMGSELVINGSGGMYQINALPFEARTPAGSATDVDGDGQLDFDDNEYEGVPEMLYIDSFVAVAGSQLTLINLTGNATAENLVQLTVWNDNEFPLSATRGFRCWFDQPLAAISPLFQQSFLQNSTPHDPSELDIFCNGVGIYETGWATVDSLIVTQNGATISNDGALLGSITASDRARFDGGHLLWESVEKQLNGEAFTP